LVTLYLTPVVYTYMAQMQAWLGRNRSQVHTEEIAPTPA
jgi:hypothetical protein